MIPPSLLNIFKEIKRDLGKDIPRDGLRCIGLNGEYFCKCYINGWSFTDRSHKHLGWERFTDQVIRQLSDNKQNLVFILWGAFAGRKKELIDDKKHLILTLHTHHHSCSRGFQKRTFWQNKSFLIKNGYQPIVW